MARTFILWLHGLGDSGPANEPIKEVFKSSELKNTKWLFPTAPYSPVSCNNGRVMPSWFDVPELPFKVGSPIDESSVLEAVKNVHAIIDHEISEGTYPENVFICGLSQGDGASSDDDEYGRRGRLSDDEDDDAMETIPPKKRGLSSIPDGVKLEMRSVDLAVGQRYATKEDLERRLEIISVA
ncbi:hypothetical protein AALP_AA7G050000, partial [Arabis alpina]